MRNQVKEHQTYICPRCRIVSVESTQFICVSVRPNVSASGVTSNSGYDDKGIHDVGTIYFGDASTVAPAKVGWIEEE